MLVSLGAMMLELPVNIERLLIDNMDFCRLECSIKLLMLSPSSEDLKLSEDGAGGEWDGDGDGDGSSVGTGAVSSSQSGRLR